ncbi:ubiquitin carboxyl-terminal hydrolase 14-like [Corticium candelabrum]|uniref:ubiquitin carboxyl-terminal hydrolase 14-like n=1 Tax=Corticium candelabrum TaxID=121492 RepID=UPI002E2701BE|nr:ubiquitin carboxyl-terminal hydrolase 14-like [Corticium candelabrum]
MPVYKVNVKWGKEKYDVELDSDEPPLLLKNVLYSLSGVSPERMKLMIKGQTVKDDDWGKIRLQDNMMFMMLGSKEVLPEAPKKKTMFLEDMSDAQLATALEMPCGLKNLGNTCYVNATLQCLKSVPELRDALNQFAGDIMLHGTIVAAHSITAAIRETFRGMDKTAEGYLPIIMLQVLHAVYPHYAEKAENGVWKQQDANELWTQVVKLLSEKLLGQPDRLAADVTVEGETADMAVEAASVAKTYSKSNIIEQYFGLEMSNIWKCIEAPDEAETSTVEYLFQLGCYISQEVKYMETGLRSRLQEQITKQSPSLGTDAVYTRTSRVQRLPAYLTIQFVRFFYKEKERVNAKILKDVKFPLKLDMFEFCSPELQQKLTPVRQKFKEVEDKLIAEADRKKTASILGSEEGSENKESNEPITMEVDEAKIEYEPYSFDDDVGSNNSGYYELNAILTHKGRSSSSGHYVAWVRRSGAYWIMFDDDKVSPVHEEDVVKLSGGGDWHSAYVLLYAPRRLQKV